MTESSGASPQADRKIRRSLRELLAALPDWDEVNTRTALAKDAFLEHWETLNVDLSGPPQTAASVLVDRLLYHRHLLLEDGRRLICGLFDVLDERGYNSNAKLQGNIRALAEMFSCSQRSVNFRLDPFPGLRTLAVDESDIFFGRELESSDLLKRMQTDQGRRLIIVSGASGSGKSSLVRAGLWAILQDSKRTPIPGSDHWVITDMFPTGEGTAFHALVGGLRSVRGLLRLRVDETAVLLRDSVRQAGALSRVFESLVAQVLHRQPEDAEWLVILDQMEELFTEPARDYRDAFIDFLLGAIDHPRFRVVATLRSDFHHRLLDSEGLREELNAGASYSLGVPGELALTQMIQGPARASRMDVEPSLVQALTADAAREPGGLALMAAALQDLLRLAEDSRMTLAHYRETLGGLRGVIEKRAEAGLARFRLDPEAVIPRVFAPLLTVDLQGTATRRRVGLGTWRDDPQARDFIESFSSAQVRLLVTSEGKEDHEPMVEVAHEALLHEWPRLARWIATKSQALQLRDEVSLAAKRYRQDAKRYPRWLHERLDPERRLLAEAGLTEELEKNEAVRDFLRPEVHHLVDKLAERDITHDERARIGDRLAELGDPRNGVGLREDGLPDVAWEDVPGGPIVLDDGAGLFEVQPFCIARYAVTYAQYRAFVIAPDGFQQPQPWEGLTKVDLKLQPGNQTRKILNHPAENVSWYDAVAFCRWLSERLGYPVRLPEEAEWQMAATGGIYGYRYPWGANWRPDHANTSASQLNRTIAVGMYPFAAAPCGALDMSGNVYEWTATVAEQADRRVMRGGSWYHHPADARATARADTFPFERLNYCGFRVARSSQPPGTNR